MGCISDIIVSREKLEGILAENRMSYSTLVDDANISRSHLYYIMNGKRSPTLYTLSQLCRALEVDDLNDIIDVRRGESRHVN